MRKYCFAILIAVFVASTWSFAQDKTSSPTVFQVADGKLELSATGAWEKVKPRSNMLEAEFKIPKVDGDERDGRLTIMGAGGSVQANIDRWIGQFSAPSGGPVTGVKPTKTQVAGQTVHWVDISGTFADSMGGPFGPKTKRDNYRMLGTIIETKSNGKYFIKLYGPKPTIDANAKAYKELVNSLKPVGSSNSDGHTVFKVAGGTMQFSATKSWEKVTPRSSMLDAEFKIPKVDGDEKDGRMTMMASGGSIEANLDRWMGQFKDEDEQPMSGVEAKQLKVAGKTIHVLDLTGTFADSMGGPFGPKTDRENYRMLGSIIETGTGRNCFLKFYGPRKTVDKNEKSYMELLKSLEILAEGSDF